MGKPLVPSDRTVAGMKTGLSRPSGVLSSSFYKDVVRYLFPNEGEGTVHCYELFCMHLGVVNNQFVATSARKLMQFLFESSGEANSPVNLL